MRIHEYMNTKYDLKERTFDFALRVRCLINRLARSYSNLEDGRQVIRSSGSVGANYIEASDPLGKKDEVMHLKIARKEAKETAYWLRLLKEINRESEQGEFSDLINEANQLNMILSSIINKVERNQVIRNSRIQDNRNTSCNISRDKLSRKKN